MFDIMAIDISVLSSVFCVAGHSWMSQNSPWMALSCTKWWRLAPRSAAPTGPDKQHTLSIHWAWTSAWTMTMNFLIADIAEDSRFFYSRYNESTEILAKAEQWYVDRTFKVVKEPFTQLFSLHTFICWKRCLKQVPLAFVIISHRTSPEYVAVLQCLFLI